MRDRLDKQRQQPDGISPKKFRSTFGPRPGPKYLHCIVCEGEDQNAKSPLVKSMNT